MQHSKPMNAQNPRKNLEHWVLSQLKNDDIEISATDWMASPDFEPVQGNTSAIFVTSKSNDELKTIFDKLKDGDNNERLQELHEMPFGIYGQFYDKFDVQWIFRGD